MQNAPFTIKQIHTDGAVSLFPASSLISVPVPGRENPPRGIAHTPLRIEFDLGEGSGVRGSIDTGVVYVINQNGKTVDTFHFPFSHDERGEPRS